MKLSEFEKEISFDRLFPSQDYHSSQGIGNLIALPLHGKLIDLGNTVFVYPETSKTIENQWEFLQNIK